jgi:hypothetical protein
VCVILIDNFDLFVLFVGKTLADLKIVAKEKGLKV